MRKKIFLIVALFCFAMSLAACGGNTTNNNQSANTSGTKTTVETKTSYDEFCAEYKLKVKSDNNVAPTLGAQKDCEFAGYSTHKETEQSTTGTLNIYGKVFNSTNTYNAYLTLSYNNVNLNSIFTHNKTTKDENKDDWYTNLKNFIETTNYASFTERKVSSFETFTLAVKTDVPNKPQGVHGTLESVDIKAIEDDSYNEETRKFGFTFYTENIYSYTNNGEKISNAVIVKYRATMRIENDEYNQLIANNPSFYVEMLINKVNHDSPNWSWKKTIVDTMTDEKITGADMSIEI